MPSDPVQSVSMDCLLTPKRPYLQFRKTKRGTRRRDEGICHRSGALRTAAEVMDGISRTPHQNAFT